MGQSSHDRDINNHGKHLAALKIVNNGGIRSQRAEAIGTEERKKENLQEELIMRNLQMNRVKR
jgi:hypothetical protein